MYINVDEEVLDLLELFGHTVLFTCMRVDRRTVPKGLYVYDVRHDDDCSGKIVEVKPHIMVNHWGTIICKEPIEMTDNGCRYVEDGDYRYTGETCKLAEYM